MTPEWEGKITTGEMSRSYFSFGSVLSYISWVEATTVLRNSKKDGIAVGTTVVYNSSEIVIILYHLPSHFLNLYSSLDLFSQNCSNPQISNCCH